MILGTLAFSAINAQGQYSIPAWVKGVAGFWAEDKITDSDFGEGLAFLIDNEIIKIPKIQELQNEITQLESTIIQLEIENNELRSKNNLPKSTPTITPIEPEIEPIVVFSEKSLYHTGSSITITAVIADVKQGVEPWVTMGIGDIPAEFGWMKFEEDGIFSYTFVAKELMWDKDGTINVVVSYDKLEAKTTFEFLSGTSSVSVTINLDKQYYKTGSEIKIWGIVSDTTRGDFVSINIRNPSGDTTYNKIEYLVATTYAKIVDKTYGDIWNESGTYTVTVNHGTKSNTLTFYFDAS